MKNKKQKITIGFVVRFIGAVAKELMVSAGESSKRQPRKRTVRTREPVEDDGLFERIQDELAAGYTVNDRPYLPDQGEAPEKQF